MKKKKTIEDQKLSELEKAEAAARKANRTRVKVSGRVIAVITTGVLCLLIAFGGVYLVNKLSVNKNIQPSPSAPAMPNSSGSQSSVPVSSPIVSGSSSSETSAPHSAESTGPASSVGIGNDHPPVGGNVEFSSMSTVSVPSVNNIPTSSRHETPSSSRLEIPQSSSTHVPDADTSRPAESSVSSSNPASQPTVPGITIPSYPASSVGSSSGSGSPPPGFGANFGNVEYVSRPASSNGFNGQDYFD